MPPGRKYTEEQRAAAVGLATSVGYSEAGRRTGINKSSIFDWAKRPEFAALRETARERVAEHFWIALQVGLSSVVEGFTSDAPLRDKAQALGILYDRHALLTGGATARSEQRDITGTLSDSELVAAVREAERITSEGRAAEEAAGPPEE